MEENPLLTMLDDNVSKWKNIIAEIERKKNELKSGEDDAFRQLCEHWMYYDFDSVKCNDLLNEMVKYKAKHPNGEFKENLQEFRGLCKGYYTKDKVVFEAFQKKMGGKKTKLKPKPTPKPVPEPKPQPKPQPTQQRIDYDDGDYYIGEIRNGQRNGRGKYFYTNGSWNEGDWINDRLNGQAVCFNAPYKHTSRGQYRDGKRFGRGIMEWDNGDIYEGGWNEQGRNGEGEMIWVNGDFYIGGWVNDKKEGQGTHYVDQYKRTDTGQFGNNQRVGRGIMAWENGDRYEGTWNDTSGKLNGQGIYYYASGISEEGQFVDEKWKKKTSSRYQPPVVPPYTSRPSNYLGLAILSTVIFWPLGIIAIIFATKVKPRYAEGNYSGAYRASRRAKNWALWGIFIVFIFYIISWITSSCGSDPGGKSSTTQVEEILIPNYYSTTTLNVRERPSANAKVIGQLKQYEECHVTSYDKTTRFATIKYKGTTAYVSADYLKPKDASNQNNVIPLPANASAAVSGNDLTDEQRRMSGWKAHALLGRVKSVTYNSKEKLEFNADGNLISGGRKYQNVGRYTWENEVYDILFPEKNVRYDKWYSGTSEDIGIRYTFDEYGRIKERGDGLNYTIDIDEYVYNSPTDKLPSSMIHVDGDETGKTVSTYKYEYLEIDNTGNWTKRKVDMKVENTEYDDETDESTTKVVKTSSTVETASYIYY
jgi:hypothetical protein